MDIIGTSPVFTCGRKRVQFSKKRSILFQTKSYWLYYTVTRTLYEINVCGCIEALLFVFPERDAFD